MHNPTVAPRISRRRNNLRHRIGLDGPLGGCVLWLAATRWDGVPGTDARTVAELNAPVVWVDSQTGFRGGRWRDALGEVALIRTDPPLIRVTPPSFPLLTRVGFREVAAWLKRLHAVRNLRALGGVPIAVVATYLEMEDYAREGAVEVLYGTDDYVAGAELMGLSLRWVKQVETRAVTRADVVLTISEPLAANWRRYGVEVAVLPNGCTPLHPARIASRTRLLPRGSDNRPIVGLVGQLSERIDIELLEELASSDLDLLLVGPVDPKWEPARFQALVNRPSVKYVGPVAAEVVPDYLLSMDVGVLPYASSEFNRASFPLKTLEYLGAGLPVVSTDLPASRWLIEDISRAVDVKETDWHIAIASSPVDFAKEVKRLAEASSRALIEERLRIAERHSWRSRAARLTTIIDGARASSNAASSLSGSGSNGP